MLFEFGSLFRAGRHVAQPVLRCLLAVATLCFSEVILDEGLLDATPAQDLIDPLEGGLVALVIDVSKNDRKCWTKFGLVR